MLHFGTYTGFDFFGFQFVSIQFLPGAGPFGNEPGYVLAVLMLVPFLNSEITGIAEHPLLATMQQVTGGYDVVDVGCRGIDAVDQAQCVIDTDVHLHAKVPRVTLSCLMHLRITLTALILGGARCRNNGGVDNTAEIKTRSQVFFTSEEQKITSGTWECEPGRSRWEFTTRGEVIHVLSGRMRVERDGEEAVELSAGSSAVFPVGWCGIWTVHETLRKVFVIYGA